MIETDYTPETSTDLVDELALVLVNNAEYCYELIQDRLLSMSPADLRGTYKDLVETR